MTTTVPRRDADLPPPPESPSIHPPNRRRMMIGAAAAFLFAVAAVWVVAFSSLLGVRTVRVEGVHIVPVSDVRAAASVTKGRPLIRLDTGAIARRVEELPAVKSASVDTTFPGTVTIRVTERTPVGYLKDGGRYELVDADGVQFRSVQKQPARLPLFAVPTGAQSTASARAIAGVAAALGSRMLPRIASIQAFDPNAITLVLTDSRVVQWGSAARSGDKARILPTLLSRPGSQFDVSNPDQVFVR